MRKLIAGAAVAGVVMMGGGNAFAGEVTGKGKPTPVANPGRVAGSWRDRSVRSTGWTMVRRLGTP